MKDIPYLMFFISRTWEYFEGEIFWQIMTAEAISEKNFDGSAGSL